MLTAEENGPLMVSDGAEQRAQRWCVCLKRLESESGAADCCSFTNAYFFPLRMGCDKLPLSA